jgi:amino-acid N-acetyltransferase
MERRAQSDTKITIRPARTADAKAICDLINYHAERGRMLHRSLESAYDCLREFLVAEGGGRIVGCVAVDLFWSDLAEIKSLAVAPHRRRRGIGSKLMQAAFDDARRLGVKKLFALTYEKDFFLRHGFEAIDRDTLPEKVWRECVYCPKADACDEAAMMRRLPRRAGIGGLPVGGRRARRKPPGARRKGP